MRQLYTFGIQESNGEQEYTFTQYVYAETLEEAKQKAEKCADEWYPNEDNDGNPISCEKLNEETWTHDGINWIIEPDVSPVDHISVMTIDGNRIARTLYPQDVRMWNHLGDTENGYRSRLLLRWLDKFQNMKTLFYDDGNAIVEWNQKWYVIYDNGGELNVELINGSDPTLVNGSFLGSVPTECARDANPTVAETMYRIRCLIRREPIDWNYRWADEDLLKIEGCLHGKG